MLNFRESLLQENGGSPLVRKPQLLEFFEYLDKQMADGQLSLAECLDVLSVFAGIAKASGTNLPQNAAGAAIVRHGIHAMKKRLAEINPALATGFTPER